MKMAAPSLGTMAVTCCQMILSCFSQKYNGSCMLYQYNSLKFNDSYNGNIRGINFQIYYIGCSLYRDKLVCNNTEALVLVTTKFTDNTI